VEFLETIGSTLAIALAATLAVALLARLGGAKPHWRMMIGISLGLALGKTLQLWLSLTDVTYPLVLGACVAGCALLIQSIGKTARSKA